MLLRIRGIYRDQALLRGVALPAAAFAQLFPQSRLQQMFVKLDPQQSRGAASAALAQALQPYPGVVARSQSQLSDQVSSRVNSVLLLFYALLAVSVLLSLLGIVNTLTLSIHEREAEIGTLRAIGMTPSQARRLLRDESVITATIGAAVGIPLGVFLAWAMTRALAGEGIVFVVPWGALLVVLAVGLLVGVLAGIGPGRRAARIDILAAIGYE